MKILIVEDNEKNLKLFKVLISSLGHETFTAMDGEAGVELARATMPDLILMDIQMPVMDGITALHVLKADEQTRSIPVIALTSYAMTGDKERFIKEGFTDYISKPIDKDSFLDTVKKAIGEPHD